MLTYQDLPRVKYASGGQSYPQPLPYDQVSLDDKVRHVGDRVAIAAAETRELAEEALKLIEVEYELLPAVFDPLQAMTPARRDPYEPTPRASTTGTQHRLPYRCAGRRRGKSLLRSR